MRGPPIRLRTQDATQALRLLLARAEGAGDLNRHIGIGQVNGEVGDLGHHQTLDLALAELVVELLALLLFVRPVSSGALSRCARSLSCSRYWPMIRIWSSGWRASSSRVTAIFAGFSAAMRNFSRSSETA